MESMWKIPMKSMRAMAAIAVLMFLLWVKPVLADCYPNGRQVAEGTRIGVLVCENGRWVERR
jgi:hypothetical protein